MHHHTRVTDDLKHMTELYNNLTKVSLIVSTNKENCMLKNENALLKKKIEFLEKNIAQRMHPSPAPAPAIDRAQTEFVNQEEAEEEEEVVEVEEIEINGKKYFMNSDYHVFAIINVNDNDTEVGEQVGIYDRENNSIVLHTEGHIHTCFKC